MYGKVIKFLKRYGELFSTAAILSATIFGAGMFSLPYVFSKAGIGIGIFYVILFAAVLSTTHYLYSEIIRATPDKHRFLGYAQIYLGRIGWSAAIFTTAIGILLTLTIFIVLSSSFIGLIFPSFPPFFASLAFWVAASLPLLLNVGKIAMLESVVVTAIVCVAAVIFVIGILNPAQPLSSMPLLNLGFLFLPYGAVIFSLAGRAGISSLMDYSAEEKIDEKTIKKAIVIGTIIPAIVYLFFVIGVLNLSKTVSQDAVSGLTYLPQPLLILLGLLGMFSVWASYISVSREIEGIFAYDFKTSRDAALAAVALVPLILFILGLRNFIALVGVMGGIFLAGEHTMVTLMWQKLTGRKPIWSYAIIILLVFGALYEVARLI